MEGEQKECGFVGKKMFFNVSGEMKIFSLQNQVTELQNMP